MTFLSQCITSCQILYGYRTMNVRVSKDFIPSRLHICTSILLSFLKKFFACIKNKNKRKMPFSTYMYSATSKLLKSNEKKRDFYRCTECSKAWLGFSNKDHVIWSNTENYIISIVQVYSIHMMSTYMNMQFSACKDIEVLTNCEKNYIVFALRNYSTRNICTMGRLNRGEWL